MCAGSEVGQKFSHLLLAWDYGDDKACLSCFCLKTQADHFLCLLSVSQKLLMKICICFTWRSWSLWFVSKFWPCSPTECVCISCSEILGRPTCLSWVVVICSWLACVLSAVWNRAIHVLAHTGKTIWLCVREGAQWDMIICPLKVVCASPWMQCFNLLWDIFAYRPHLTQC